MRVFVTGATGFVGSAIVRELIDAGHEVLGLARSDEAAAALAAAGAAIHRGSLDDLDSLRRGAAGADGVIHAAFIHDFSDITAAGESDRLAVEAIGAELAQSGRPLVVTSVIGHLTPGQLGTEEDAPYPGSVKHRSASEEAALALAAQGVRVSVLRLPLSVHGDGDIGCSGPNQYGPYYRNLGICGRWRKPLASCAPAGCRTSLPAGAGISSCRSSAACNRR